MVVTLKNILGWRKEPARHALAAKGIETKQKKQKNAGVAVGKATPPSAVAPKPTEAVKESAVDKVLAVALAEGGSEAEAVELLEDDQWLDRAAQKVVDSETQDAKERTALKAEVVHAIHKNPTMGV